MYVSLARICSGALIHVGMTRIRPVWCHIREPGPIRSGAKGPEGAQQRGKYVAYRGRGSKGIIYRHSVDTTDYNSLHLSSDSKELVRCNSSRVQFTRSVPLVGKMSGDHIELHVIDWFLESRTKGLYLFLLVG
jgi:hypothetical protein